MAASKSYQLTFNSNTNEIIRISIPRADETLSTSALTSNMQNLISNGNVLTGTGKPQSIISADLVTTDVSLMDLDN